MFTLPFLKHLNDGVRTGAAVFIAVAALTACSGGSSNGKNDREARVTTTPAAAGEVLLTGSGASFPFPIYAKWFKDFSRNEQDIRVKYQPKGSGAGIQDFINATVDFAASDAAMQDEEIARVERGVVLLPTTAGEVVLAYNLKDIQGLKLPRAVYPQIFLGKIERWNDPQIAAANPSIELPDTKITVVTRSDSSGTSSIFTAHLSEIHPDFKTAVGQAKVPAWPNRANFVKAPKNDGVAALVKQTYGAIGYMEHGFAKLTGLPVAQLENKSGTFVSPGPRAGAAALASAEFPAGTLPGTDVPNLMAAAADPMGADAYPIVSFTWLLAYTDQDDRKAAAMRKLVEYMLSDEAQGQAESLGYIPLPQAVREKVREAAQHIK